ncbi:hypothetical protein CEP52_011468 [Fusarium oligoseptatum]|uniref:Uncharacterized protein n=1 Tax=Fusarium oligoseptatum TaxID=2604345 RepID=A0A428T360_9HYPO|nr:hypothetical protein CEP52_011468 [Fusarium oligoseptatum]
MASLVPISPKGISAQYHGLGRYLELKAEGEIPGFFFTPFFEREVWAGGLRFSIKAFAGGAGKTPPSKNVNISYKLPIVLPIDHFNNKSVLVETAYGTSEIKIEYIGWPEAPQGTELAVNSKTSDGVTAARDEANKIHTITTVLPPIESHLSDDGTLSITAVIPKEAQSLLDIEFNSEFLKLVTSSVGDGLMKWEVKWAKLPVGKDNPQLVNVITTTDITIPILPPVKEITKVIQPHIVYRVRVVTE